MMSMSAFALFTFAFMVALATILSTVLPYRARILCLLAHGTQSRVGALPPLASRGARRATPRLTALPANLRAVA
ncbi:hypothetical protein [Sphingomonas sp.]|uniref:hypothetical protein n=1 Tax=Sphingomonas sp. TaxID=28214 RepID=UPI002C7D1B3F|nr:hypothetical protein [Sphingomonas sp.]HTG38357.1 hypothetical protein [Sphingomonas sp.]